ncbi:MAG: AEC family transporter [Candidatus Omnitrophota bacterium]
MEFFLSFLKIFPAVLEIFIVIICGFFFFKLKLLNTEQIRGLGSLVITLFLPCLIFSYFLQGNFSFSQGFWWIYPILGIGVSGAGILISKLFLFFDKSIENKKEFIALVCFQNCGYLPLVLVRNIFPAIIADALFVNIFLFIQGFNLIFWSFGMNLLSGEKKSGYHLKAMVNAPFITLIISLLIAGFGWKALVPRVLLRSCVFLGECTLPIALLVLGAILAESLAVKIESKRFLYKVVLLKMIVMPLAAIAVLKVFKSIDLMSFVILIECAMPSALNLSVVAYHKKSAYQLISQGVLFTHLAGLFTIPALITLFALIRR